MVALGLEELMRQYGETRKKACPKCCRIQCNCKNSSNALAPKSEASSNSEEAPLWKEPSWRHLPDPDPMVPKPPIKILFIGANNSESAKLSLEQEVKEIRTQFMFEHNMPNQNLDVSIRIYSVSGKMV